MTKPTAIELHVTSARPLFALGWPALDSLPRPCTLSERPCIPKREEKQQQQQQQKTKNKKKSELRGSNECSHLSALPVRACILALLQRPGLPKGGRERAALLASPVIYNSERSRLDGLFFFSSFFKRKRAQRARQEARVEGQTFRIKSL